MPQKNSVQILPILLGFGIGLGFGIAGTAAKAQQPGPKPGVYVCYDLVLRAGLTFNRMEYRYEYRDTFRLLPNGGYQKDTPKQAQGRYRYDPKTRILTFASGPYAGTGLQGEFSPASENKDKPAKAKGVGVDNIILTKPGAPNRDNDWFCSVE
jgi:hypothetical protein